MLWPPYKWWFCCLCILCFLRFCISHRVDGVRTGGMLDVQLSLLGSSDAFGSASLGLHVWELCFSLVSPLWELCYSLAFG